MADAIDVVAGRKPSLAKEDPRNLKAGARATALVFGAGLAAGFRGNDADAQDQAARATTRPAGDPTTGGISMDLFSPLFGKARLVRFAIWEDPQAEHIDLSVGMTDGESAEQFKNLLLGVKGLLSLTQSQYRQYIDPLEVQTGNMQVDLKWSFPTAKLIDLYRQMQPESNHESSGPGNNSASQPTR